MSIRSLWIKFLDMFIFGNMEASYSKEPISGNKSRYIYMFFVYNRLRNLIIDIAK